MTGAVIFSKVQDANLRDIIDSQMVKFSKQLLHPGKLQLFYNRVYNANLFACETFIDSN